MGCEEKSRGASSIMSARVSCCSPSGGGSVDCEKEGRGAGTISAGTGSCCPSRSFWIVFSGDRLRASSSSALCAGEEEGGGSATLSSVAEVFNSVDSVQIAFCPPLLWGGCVGCCKGEGKASGRVVLGSGGGGGVEERGGGGRGVGGEEKRGGGGGGAVSGIFSRHLEGC